MNKKLKETIDLLSASYKTKPQTAQLKDLLDKWNQNKPINFNQARQTIIDYVLATEQTMEKLIRIAAHAQVDAGVYKKKYQKIKTDTDRKLLHAITELQDLEDNIRAQFK